MIWKAIAIAAIIYLTVYSTMLAASSTQRERELKAISYIVAGIIAAIAVVMA